MEALFVVAAVIVVLLAAMGAIPGLLKKTANRGTITAVPPISPIDPPTPPAVFSEDDDRRHTFDRLLLLQSLLEEFNVPLEEQKTVLEPLVLKMLPATAKKENPANG